MTARCRPGGEDGTVRLWNVPRAPDDTPPSLRATLIGARGGWAAVSPGGGFNHEGDIHGEFWQVVGMSRFEPDELGASLPGVHRLPMDAEI